MKTKLVAFIAFLLLLPACCYPVRYDGPYKGRVIDATTGAPIEGVVVLGTWSKVAVTPAGGVSSYYDAQETVTDKKGEFEIRGLGLKILSNVAPMNVLIFKAGYEYIGLGPWDSLKEDPILKKKAEWEGEKAIISLRKLTMEERKKQGSPDFSSQIPGTRMKMILEQINNDRIERHLEPYRLGGNKE